MQSPCGRGMGATQLTIYRAKGWSFANNPDFMHVSTDPEFWDNVGEKFYAKYNVVDKKHKEWADLVLRGQPIVSPFGREWLISMKETRYGLEIPWTVLTNYPVQGTGADIMMIARVSFANRLKRLGLSSKLRGEVKLVTTVHDSIGLDVQADEDVQLLVNLFHQVFDDLPANFKRLFGYDWAVPLECEVKAGPNMKDQTKISRSDK